MMQTDTHMPEGFSHPQLPDLSGQMLGGFQVLYRAHTPKRLHYWVKCLSCGKERAHRAQNLRKWPQWQPRCKCGATS